MAPSGTFNAILSSMEMLLEKQLQVALTERKAVMGEFLRLKAELACTQQRNDDLRFRIAPCAKRCMQLSTR